MPFITPDRRKIIDKDGIYSLEVIEVGDWCYVYYKSMVKRWKENPRWTTAHKIYEEMIRANVGDIPTGVDSELRTQLWKERAAHELAWQVFFQIHVLPSELKKREENGDV